MIEAEALLAASTLLGKRNEPASISTTGPTSIRTRSTLRNFPSQALGEAAGGSLQASPLLEGAPTPTLSTLAASLRLRNLTEAWSTLDPHTAKTAEILLVTKDGFQRILVKLRILF